MNMKSFYWEKGVMHSSKAEEGARLMFENIENNNLKMDILPNQYARFTGELEEIDYITYGKFLQSVNGQKVLKMLEEENAGNFVEL